MPAPKATSKSSSPTLSFIVPTHREDRPLRRCLDSIAFQLAAGDEVIVVGDVHDGPLPAVQQLVGVYGKQFLYAELDAGGHDYGHSQVNYGIEHARADYIHVNDDDDVWTSNAADLMRTAAADYPGRPLLFRFVSYHGGQKFWHQPGRLIRNQIGGHCLVAPNLPGKVGRWAPAYNGDFDWLESTINLHGGVQSAVWLDQIVAIARPR